MEQPIANITKNDIQLIILHDYPKHLKKDILELLRKYKGNSLEGSYRVWASILKLAGGDIEKLKNNVKTAINDYRDIIAKGEYPLYSQKVGFDSDDFAEAELKKTINADLQQYQNWLNSIKQNLKSRVREGG